MQAEWRRGGRRASLDGGHTITPVCPGLAGFSPESVIAQKAPLSGQLRHLVTLPETSLGDRLPVGPWTLASPSFPRGINLCPVTAAVILVSIKWLNQYSESVVFKLRRVAESREGW